MYKKYADMMVKALRSGNYKQTVGALEKNYKVGRAEHCCLGVLGRELEKVKPELFKDTKVRVWASDSEVGNWFIGENYSTLPNEIASVVGFKDPVKSQRVLWGMNDTFSKSFEEIAGYVEKNYKTL